MLAIRVLARVIAYAWIYRRDTMAKLFNVCVPTVSFYFFLLTRTFFFVFVYSGELHFALTSPPHPVGGILSRGSTTCISASTLSWAGTIRFTFARRESHLLPFERQSRATTIDPASFAWSASFRRERERCPGFQIPLIVHLSSFYVVLDSIWILFLFTLSNKGRCNASKGARSLIPFLSNFIRSVLDRWAEIELTTVSSMTFIRALPRDPIRIFTPSGVSINVSISNPPSLKHSLYLSSE